MIYKGVTGECTFKLIVNPKPPKSLIELDGDSPKIVKEGDCVKLSVRISGIFKNLSKINANDNGSL